MVLITGGKAVEASTGGKEVEYESREYETREHATTAVLQNEHADFKLAVLRQGTHKREWSIGRKYRGFDIMIGVGVICEFDCSLGLPSEQASQITS